MDNLTPTKLAQISRRARQDSKLQFTSLAQLLNTEFLRECYWSLGKEKAVGINGNLSTVADEMRLAEEPCAGNLQARFCERR